MEKRINQTRIVLKKGDITEEVVDVIVNAANSGLMGGGGVDGAIHRAGGSEILEECKKIRQEQGRCPTGEAVATTAGQLSASFVVHTVGPVWQGGQYGEEQLLCNAYTNSLKLGAEKGMKTIAFPSISTGIYGYPIEQAVKVALNVVKDFAEENPAFEEVRFILFSEHDLSVYREALGNL